jgi:hypothetical protein
MSKQPEYLVCSFWGQQCVPSVERKCVKCGCALAMDALNEGKDVGLEHICLRCVTKLKNPQFGEALIFGKRGMLSVRMEELLRAKLEEIRRAN